MPTVNEKGCSAAVTCWVEARVYSDHVQGHINHKSERSRYGTHSSVHKCQPSTRHRVRTWLHRSKREYIETRCRGVSTIIQNKPGAVLIGLQHQCQNARRLNVSHHWGDPSAKHEEQALLLRNVVLRCESDRASLSEGWRNAPTNFLRCKKDISTTFVF